MNIKGIGKVIVVPSMALLLLAGCASQKEVDSATAQIAALENRVAALQQEADSFRISVVEAQSNTQVSFDSAADQIVALQSQVDQAFKDAEDATTRAQRLEDQVSYAVRQADAAARTATSVDTQGARQAYQDAQQAYYYATEAAASDTQEMKEAYREAIAFLVQSVEANPGQHGGSVQAIPSLMLLAFWSEYFDYYGTSTEVVWDTVEAVILASGNQALIDDWQAAEFDRDYGYPEDEEAFAHFLRDLALAITAS
ncbi:MAG: hypothetical protein HY532_04720 [Chloroflexi bacterium]|nr:hypothetical protein [Chloroflexota bacterium]